MLALKLALVVLVLLVIGVLRDRRSFSNAILLGFGFALLALGAANRLADAPSRWSHWLLEFLLVLIAIGPFLVAGYLLQNGVVMARREGMRPKNLLSLLAGLGILSVIAVAVAALRAGSRELSLFSALTMVLFGYVSFQFVSFVVYAWLYARLPVRHRADFVVVLGSGLLGGGRVPPLLAGRLDRGLAVYRKQRGDPLLIVSGGKGSDEQVSEAAAMSAYLVQLGLPADHVLLEDQSRTTEENLVYSKAIMARLRPDGYRCVIVTSSFHVFRAAIIARRTRVHGQVTGARTAGYYWPTAMIREFGAVFLSYRWINLSICALIVVLPTAFEYLRPHL
ncbi:MAG TPA: YdcF family protein [Streptosporangiaceae bacterium]